MLAAYVINGGMQLDTVKGYADKKDVAAFAGKSVKWVQREMSKGLPFLQLGHRSVRFDLREVDVWLKQRYSAQRFKPLPRPKHIAATVA